MQVIIPIFSKKEYFLRLKIFTSIFVLFFLDNAKFYLITHKVSSSSSWIKSMGDCGSENYRSGEFFGRAEASLTPHFLRSPFGYESN